MSNAAILENAHNIGGKKFATIPVSEIKIDAGYQRRLREKVNRMVANWDYNLCDVVLVSYRNDKFYVIDGQHRVAAAKRVGAEFLPCQIVEGLSREEEAARFVALNSATSPLSQYDTWKANLLCGDPVDTEVKRICDKWDIEITDTYGCGYARLGSLYDARRIVRTTGSKAFDWILDTLHAAQWHMVKGGHNGAVLSAINNAYKEFGPDVAKDIVSIIKNKTPKTLRAAALDVYPEYSGNRALIKYIEDEVKKATNMVTAFADIGVMDFAA